MFTADNQLQETPMAIRTAASYEPLRASTAPPVVGALDPHAITDFQRRCKPLVRRVVKYPSSSSALTSPEAIGQQARSSTPISPIPVHATGGVVARRVAHATSPLAETLTYAMLPQESASSTSSAEHAAGMLSISQTLDVQTSSPSPSVSLPSSPRVQSAAPSSRTTSRSHPVSMHNGQYFTMSMHPQAHWRSTEPHHSPRSNAHLQRVQYLTVPGSSASPASLLALPSVSSPHASSAPHSPMTNATAPQHTSPRRTPHTHATMTVAASSSPQPLHSTTTSGEPLYYPVQHTLPTPPPVPGHPAKNSAITSYASGSPSTSMQRSAMNSPNIYFSPTLESKKMAAYRGTSQVTQRSSEQKRRPCTQQRHNNGSSNPDHAVTLGENISATSPSQPMSTLQHGSSSGSTLYMQRSSSGTASIPTANTTERVHHVSVNGWFCHPVASS
jgi:hypothetical protein